MCVSPAKLAARLLKPWRWLKDALHPEELVGVDVLDGPVMGGSRRQHLRRSLF